MLCKNCGAQIADDSVFCTSCGFRVRPVSEAVQENAAVTAEQMPVQTEQAVQESATAENTVQAESIQESAAAENTAQAEPIQESTAAENAAQTEPIQESATAENTVQAESIQESIDAENGTQAENAAQEGAADGSAQPDSMPGEQPQMNGVPNGQMAYGQPQMNGVPNGQMPYGQPQMNGAPNGQMAYGQPQMNGMPNGQMAYGQPQAGSIPNGVPYGQAMKQPKKPFVMPAAVNVAGGILAIAAVAVFVCVLLFGKPEEKKSDLVVGTLAIPAQQQAVEGSDYLDIDLSNVTYQLEIPETDGYRAAQELAEGYIFADSDTRYLREWDLYTYSGSELWHAYFEILAREGVDVSEIDEEEHEYFQRKSWYDPTISLIDILMEMDEDQVARYSEMIENEKNPIGEILLDAGILNETEVFNMELIEEYLTLGTTTMEGPGDALEDMLEE
ncbi:MAG: zinc-ribbon domain-containing protein [Lachnospiraceae bacterium]|nr:zinc-ribbon domain-containing protein [Lachnospiraceae bacterium]